MKLFSKEIEEKLDYFDSIATLIQSPLSKTQVNESPNHLMSMEFYEKPTNFVVICLTLLLFKKNF